MMWASPCVELQVFFTAPSLKAGVPSSPRRSTLFSCPVPPLKLAASRSICRSTGKCSVSTSKLSVSVSVGCIWWSVGKCSFPTAQWSVSISNVPKRRRFPGTATAISPSPSSSSATSSTTIPATTVVRNFYDGINRRDLASVASLISEDCIYEDLVFSKPFAGRKAIMDFFNKFMESISSDLKFIIDDISAEDSSAIGVSWHLDWRGRPFPLSKGCSFYRLEVLDGKRQIVYGRDCVEPAIKSGDIVLILIRGLTLILQQFPQLADRL